MRISGGHARGIPLAVPKGDAGLLARVVKRERRDGEPGVVRRSAS